MLPHRKFSSLYRPRTLYLAALLLLALPIALMACDRADEPDPDAAAITARDVFAGVHYDRFLLGDDEVIYFSSDDDKVVSARPDGSRLRVLGDGPAKHFAADETTLYFVLENDSPSLHKSDLDGSNRVRIRHAALKNLILFDDALHAIDLETHQAVRMQKDGTGRETLADAMVTSFIPDQDALYLAFADADQGIARYKAGDEEPETLLPRAASSLNVEDGTLYFIDPQAENRIFSFRPGDPEAKLRSEFGLDRPFLISDGYLYAIDSQNQQRILRWPLPQDDERLRKEDGQLVVDDAAAAFVLCSDAVYYRRAGGHRIYRVESAAARPQRVH